MSNGQGQGGGQQPPNEQQRLRQVIKRLREELREITDAYDQLLRSRAIPPRPATQGQRHRMADRHARVKQALEETAGDE